MGGGGEWGSLVGEKAGVEKTGGRTYSKFERIAG